MVHPYLFIGLDRRLIFSKDKNFIIAYVAEILKLSIEDITQNKSRKQEILFPRYICAYLLRMNCRYSTEKIGQILGGLDHATILNAYKNVLNKENNPKLKKMFDQVVSKIDYEQFYKRLEYGESYEALHKFPKTLGRETGRLSSYTPTYR